MATRRALGWLHRDFCHLSNHSKSRCGPGILSRKHTISQQPTNKPAPRPQTLDSSRTTLEILHSHFVSLQTFRRLLLQRHTRHHLDTRAQNNSGHRPRHRRTIIMDGCFSLALALRIFCSIIILCALFSRIANTRPDQRHFPGTISIHPGSRFIHAVRSGI